MYLIFFGLVIYRTMVKPPFVRAGGKTTMKEVILPLIPDHKTYVEPFFGGGAIFWNKEPAERNVINDIDKEVIKGIKLLKKAPTEESAYSNPTTIEAAQRFVNASHSSTADKLLKQIILTKGTFGGSGKGKIYKSQPFRDNLLRHIDEYKDRLKNTKIYSQDYRGLISYYDSPSTFFFLDPPYEKSEGIYDNPNIDYEDMAKRLKKIKGKFLLTMNDSKGVRDVFKDFKIKGLTVVSGGSGQAPTSRRKEVIIRNY